MKSLKALLLMATVMVTLANSHSLAASGWNQTLRGKKDNVGFTVGVNPKQTAALVWDDGYPGFYANYDAEVSKEYRCLCDVYVNGPRRIVAEYDFTHPGHYQSVTFEKVSPR